MDSEGWKAWEKSDLYLLTKARPDRARKALSGRLFLYAGDRDEVGLYETTNEYSELLDEMNIPHVFKVLEGAHHIDYLGREAFLRDLWQTAWNSTKEGP